MTPTKEKVMVTDDGAVFRQNGPTSYKFDDGVLWYFAPSIQRAEARLEPFDRSAIDHSSPTALVCALVCALKKHHVHGLQYWPGTLEAPRFQFIDEYGRRGLPWRLLRTSADDETVQLIVVSDDRTTKHGLLLVLNLSNGMLRLDPGVHPEPGGLVRHLFATVAAGHRIVCEPEGGASEMTADSREPIEELAEAVSEPDADPRCKRPPEAVPAGKRLVTQYDPASNEWTSAYIDGHDGATLHTKPLNGKPVVKKPWPRWVGILALLAAMTAAYHADWIIERATILSDIVGEAGAEAVVWICRADPPPPTAVMSYCKGCKNCGRRVCMNDRMVVGGIPVKWTVERVEDGREYGYIHRDPKP